MPIVAHFFPDVSAGFQPPFPAGTGFYRELATAGQLACAADAGWPGAGRRGPQVKPLSGEPLPAGADGAEMARTGTSEEPATASRTQPVQRGWAGAINRASLLACLQGR
ncbi:complete genome; segment 4/17 [Photorhabdus asymbiotica]|uniref:Uncharacterized protein n=1 Tax=Photorhabdus asymbiotica subsp. asymbiotica (strain ATCC 43949 / 3105-77) TaxID=553480 RepID=C7BNM7_PHOAA|nr:conserved hypothetical protein [Photorhabdus asymbiotica]CAQ85086.1 complete genome; segment 4/17 [Photorhabdus asymbiotica]CAR67576.1 Hypothetical Protein PA-RVA15-17-1007 [Photorhabdus asymbiotica subsp. asymbiotica ATCC 43949]